MSLRLLSRALDLVYPPRCVGCGEFGSFFCELCADRAMRAEPPRCPRCWMPGREESCLACYRHAPAFSALRSVFTYGGAARKAVHAIKFNGVSALAPVMGGRMADVLLEWNVPVDVLVPVPLSAVRRRTRGYNQAELLAREVARAVGLPVEAGSIRRVRRTAPQTDLNELGRHTNVAGAFGRGKRSVRGNVLLVDDVATTTATLDACARVLLEEGAGRVFALTFARED